MRAILDLYHRILAFLLALSVAVLVIPISLQILARYTQLFPAYIWTEEMSRFLFIWMVMIGAMIGLREKTHFEVDVWPDLKPRPAALVRIVANLFVLIFALVFLYWGWRFLMFGWYQHSELADLPMGFIFAAWPLAGLTWLIFLGEAFFDDIRTLTGHGPPPDHIVMPTEAPEQNPNILLGKGAE